MSDPAYSGPSIRRPPPWQTVTPQQPTVAILQPTNVPGPITTLPGTGSAPALIGHYWGIGAPTFSAPNGTLYSRYDGAASTTLYVNTSGASTSGTTWTAVTVP